MTDERHPLSRLTRSAERSHAIYRVLDTGESGRRHRAHLAFRGPAAAAAELVRDLRGGPGESHVELVQERPEGVDLVIETHLDASAPPLGLASLHATLAEKGLHAFVDPIVAVGGRVRVRLVLPRQADPQEILRALQEVPRACGFADFRVQRIGTISPIAHVELARRALPPEQESLLALAASMGYYETPKVVTLHEIARTVGLSISPVHKRLKAAEETIVAQFVAPTLATEARRRRNGSLRVEPTGPWELQVRLRGDVGPSAFLSQAPGARALMQVLSADGGRDQVATLLVIAPDEAQTKLLASLEDRPDVGQIAVLERTPQHVVCRMVTRDRGAYAFGWWNDSWGTDASLRSLVFHEGAVHVRALLVRPHTPERLAERLQACAHSAGWAEWEVVALRPLAAGGPPIAWPEPLTPRQVEVLRVAHALGYYRTPRGCTLEHVAKTLGVSANAIHKNLVLAESKLIAGYLACGL